MVMFVFLLFLLFVQSLLLLGLSGVVDGLIFFIEDFVDKLFSFFLDGEVRRVAVGKIFGRLLKLKYVHLIYV